MKLYFVILLSIVCCSSVFCQSSVIEGTVVDEESIPLIGATIVVLDEVDTTMISFGVTDTDGRFKVFDVPTGGFLLQVSYTGYSDTFVSFTKGEEKKVFEPIILSIASEVLEEVSIKAEHIPMGIIGDTINYNAAAFQTRPGASVEDLLRKLPGIEVARDGSIKAQGEDVESILVDGKEFFSGDPTIATKNLDAEAVDKVQVYDKQSEEAEFTGVEDGNEEKTINLKLKEGYKSGGFGRVEVNGGTEDSHLLKGNYNRFSSTAQASIIANSNNINQQAFSFNDYTEFMGGFQNMLAAGGFAEYGALSPDQSGVKGINNQNSIGANLNFSRSSKLKLNANYLYAGSDRNVIEEGRTDTYIDGSEFIVRDTSSNQNDIYNHRLNTKLNLNPSDKVNLVWTNRFFGFIDNQMKMSESQYFLDDFLTNRIDNNLDLQSSSVSYNSKIIYRQKFNKKGRNLMLSGSIERLSRNEDLGIRSVFLSSLLTDVNQMQSFVNGQNIKKAGFSFTEPIGKKLYFDVRLGFIDKLENPIREYFNVEQLELILDNDLSGVFSKDWTSRNIGISLKRNRKKMKLNSGLDVNLVSLSAYDNDALLNNTSRLYFLPFGSVNWSLKGTRRLDLNYNTNIVEPSIGQMVNQVNNANPNLVILGNPNLMPEYNHSLTLGYNYFDSFNFSSLFWNLTTIYSPNKIVNSRSFVDNVVTEIQPINSTSFVALSGYIQYSTPIRKLKMKLGIDSRASYSTYKTFVEAEETDFSNAQLSTKLTLQNRNKDIFDVEGGVDLSLSAYASDLNSNFDTPFFRYDLFLDGHINLGHSWSVSSKYDLRTFNNIYSEGRNTVNLLQASIQKSFLEEKLILKISSFDLLNQNIGLDRTGNINTLSINRFNTLGRYFLIGASYKLG